MGGNQSTDASGQDERPAEVPKSEEAKDDSQKAEEAKKVEEAKKPETAATVTTEAEKPSVTEEAKQEVSKSPEPAKKSTPAKSPATGPLQPGAQPKGKPAAKPAGKAAAKAGAGAPAPQGQVGQVQGAAKKKAQPGPPQQPGLITPEAQAAPKKAAKGEKGGKGGGKKSSYSGIQLCVRNLVKDATTEQLQNLFQPFGELIGVDVKKNTDGTCRGYGFVTYASMGDANKAISAMNNKQVEGKNLIVVLSDRQQGTTKAERESQAPSGKGGGKGKEGKEGKGGDKGKGKTKQPANIATTLPAPTQPQWPYQAEGAAAYPYGYGYPPMVSPMAAYANQGLQGYPNTQQAALQAMQAQFISQAQQALQMQAFHSSLQGLNPNVNPNMAAGASNQQPAPTPPAPPTASAAAAAPSDQAPPTLKQEHEGQLKSISAKNGYGFIACNETKVHYKRDVFVDSSLLPEGIQVNDKVVFSLTLSEKGHPRATSVRQVGQVPAR